MIWELVLILKGREEHEGSQRQGKLKEPLPGHVQGDGTETGDRWDWVVASRDVEKHVHT